MAGDEEASARAVLAEMQLRISEGPTSALGIGEVVTPEEVRTAFLGLTKQFHPARFGRLSPEVQRLANEVFLGIKGAHDHMLKVLGSSPKAARSTTGGAAAFARGTDRGRPSSPVIGPPNRASTPAMGVPVPSRTSTGPQGQRPVTGGIPAIATGTQRATTGSMPAVQRPTGSIPVVQRPTTGSMPPLHHANTPATGVRTPVPPGTQPGIGGGTQPLGRASPASGGVTTPVPPGTQPGVGLPRGTTPSPAVARTTTPPTVARTMTPPPARSGDSFNPPTVRNVAAPQPTQPIPKSAAFDETAAFRQAAALMEAKNWPGATQALTALVARVPHSRNYQAWLCYARGREAYLNGKPDDAIAEMKRAVQLDPDLAHAKHALAELQRRR